MRGPAWLILPTFNEAENIERIIDAARTELARTGEFRILVVDDGSPDGTGDIADRLAAEHAEVEVLHRTEKAGLGPAYLAGFAHALANGAGLVMEMDSDFSHDPADLPRLVATVDAGADLALGSRYTKGGGVTDWGLLRRFISRGGCIYASMVLSLPYRDLTGGFKCFRREVLEAIDLETIHARGYAFQVELTYRAHLRGFKIEEVPIVFRDRLLGESKMSPKIATEALWMLPSCALVAASAFAANAQLVNRRSFLGGGGNDPTRYAFVYGVRRTRTTLAAWQAHPLPILARWLGGGLLAAGLLLLCVLGIAAIASPGSATTVGPPFVVGHWSDVMAILSRNLLVLALHAMACVAGFIAGSSLPLQAPQHRGLARKIHEHGGPIAIAVVVGATTFSLSAQAYVLGTQTASVAAHLGTSPGLLLLALAPHAIPELAALFMPLAAWIFASRRGEWEQLLAATVVTVAIAVPILVVTAVLEVYVAPSLVRLIV